MQLGEALAEVPGVRIPRIYPELSGRRIMTQELIDAPNIGQLVAGGTSADGVDRVALADRLISVFLRQIFTIGIFHADPHPGNILVEPDGTIVLIDLGAVGRLGAGHREAVLDMLAAASMGNAAGLRQALGQITLFDQRVDLRQLEMALESFLARHLRAGRGHRRRRVRGPDHPDRPLRHPPAALVRHPQPHARDPRGHAQGPRPDVLARRRGQAPRREMMPDRRRRPIRRSCCSGS